MKHPASHDDPTPSTTTSASASASGRGAAESVASWDDIEPYLNDAMGELGAKDRDVLVLRFLQDHSIPELAAELGLSEAAAKMRISRALRRMRKVLDKNGVTAASAAALGSTIAANSALAAPAHLAGLSVSTALSGGSAAASAAAIAIGQATLKAMAWVGMKLTATVLLLAAGVALMAGTLAASGMWSAPRQVGPAALVSRFPLGAVVPPEQGVVFNLAGDWHVGAGWRGSEQRRPYASRVNMIKAPDGSLKLQVHDPDAVRVWINYPAVKLDISKYPIVVVRYRARQIEKASNCRYGIWVDDGAGPNGGVGPWVLLWARSVIDDGQIHELVIDTRTLTNKTSVAGLAVGVTSRSAGDAEFELLGLQFEALADAPAVVTEDQPIRLTLVDAALRPVRGARILCDGDRLNFSRSAVTDENGVAVVTPLSHGGLIYALSVQHPDFQPTTITTGSGSYQFVMARRGFLDRLFGN